MRIDTGFQILNIRMSLISKTEIALGAICDVEIESEKAEVIAVVVRGRFRFFGLFGKGEEFVIAWDQVKVIGEDAVLVCFDRRPEPRRPKHPRHCAENELY